MQYIIFVIILGIIIFGLSYYYKKKQHAQWIEHQKEIERIKERGIEEFIFQQEEKIRRQIQKDTQALRERETEIEQHIKDRFAHVGELNRQITQLSQTLDEQREHAKIYEDQLCESAKQRIDAYEIDLRKIAEFKVSEYEQEKLKAAELALAEMMADIGSKTEAARAQLEQMEASIGEYSAKQAAINEAILRQRAIEEQQDFYRVCLAPEVANDVELLNSIRKNLKKPEIVDKIIYDNYIAKPVLEMVKRVLQNSTCSGIYKITCLKTGEIYIGKSTDIKNRWQQHCKTVFNCGTIASSLLHTKMKQHGIEQFTFELVEQVPKDQLSEREKFYISFYQSKEVGLNERQG